jgi:branched-chain amino acid aminotransferase
MLELCRHMQIPVAEKTLQRHDLYVSDECFLTGTGAEIVPVTKIDSRPIGSGLPGSITRRLIDAFHHRTREQ